MKCAPPRQSAVITGVGAVSAFGVGLPALFDGLRAGRSAIGPINWFDASAFPTRVAGEVATEVHDGGVSHAWLQRALPPQQLPQTLPTTLAHYAALGAWRDRKTVFGLLAALEAWQMAGMSLETNPDNIGLVIALGLEQGFLQDFGPRFAAHPPAPAIDWQSAPPRPGIVFRSEVDLCAQLLSDLLPLRGPTRINVSACAAGGLALAQAASLIERGAASVVLCGAADSMLNPLGLGGMSRLGAPSPRNTFDACRPFDSRRDGLVIGEGAAMFVLEAQSHAQARGAQVLARVLGYGSTQDAYRATAPRPDGAAAQRAMQQALAHARLPAGAVGYINAHGTGTPLNDVAESRAIAAVFGDGEHAQSSPPVSSIKGAVGHLMAASGALEAASCLLPLLHDVLPGTAHHQQTDPQCRINVIGEQPMVCQPGSVQVVLSNSFGFGGQNAALLLGRA
jgi:3-oxoacyl-[acyl-carrier-protein] synthase II